MKKLYRNFPSKVRNTGGRRWLQGATHCKCTLLTVSMHIRTQVWTL